MKKGYGVRIDPDGKTEVVELDGSLESLQKQVGGYIETVRLPYTDCGLMIVNTEGKLLGLEKNPLASAIRLGNDAIAGPALLLKGAKGDEIALMTEKGAKKLIPELIQAVDIFRSMFTAVKKAIKK